MNRFPDCIVFTMPQRTEPWYKERAGKLTGSAMGTWLAERPECRMTIPEIKAWLDKLGEPYKSSEPRPALLRALAGRIGVLPESHLKSTIDARNTAINRILAEMSKCEVPDEWEVDPTGPPPRNPGLWAIWNGIRLEPEAVENFEKHTGLKIRPVGFCRHKSQDAGCSPDGLIENANEGFEGKCPLPVTHVRYIRKGTLPDEYKAQVHGSMAVTGATAWWFQSYCPGLPPLIVKVERDEFTEAMEAGLWEFSEHLAEAKSQLAAMWKPPAAPHPTTCAICDELLLTDGHPGLIGTICDDCACPEREENDQIQP